MKILIVDDAKVVTSLLQVYCARWNAEFLVARDGEEGLRLARSATPDLVITDVQMPRMDGFELCAAIRSDPHLSKLPVVMLTALGDAHTRQKGQLVGATAFLKKPVSPDELQGVLGKLLPIPPR